jgi:hypothetical protein
MTLAVLPHVFGMPQWKAGLGLILTALIVLLFLPRGRGMKILSSLMLTVIMLIASVALVWFGSMAQVDEGLWNAQERWFKSWFVWGERLPFIGLPYFFPGGHLLGSILILNLLAAHWKRFQWNFQKAGIQLTHVGIILLLVGQLATDELAVESHMGFREGETKQYTEHHRDSELAFLVTQPDGTDRVVSIPEKMVAGGGEIQHAELPFKVQIKSYAMNGEVLSRKEVMEAYNRLSGALGMVEGKYSSTDLVQLAEEAKGSDGRAAVWREALRAMGERELGDIEAAVKRVIAKTGQKEKLGAELQERFRTQMLDANIRQGGASAYAAAALREKKILTEESLPTAATNGAGLRYFAISTPEEKTMEGRNIPHAVVELNQGGKSLGSWLIAPALREQDVTTGEKPWRVVMRFERYYLPYTMKLLKTTHDVYQGTDTAKDYRSRVMLDNPKTGERRETEIYMNQPLRYEGLTFYQYQMGTDQRRESVRTSTLQVVENPGWLTPYAGCLIVGFGMLWQFLWHLGKFLSKRMGLPAPEIACPHPLLPFAAAVLVAPHVFLLGVAFAKGSEMAIIAYACTLAITGVLALQLVRGRYLGFHLIFIAVATLLLMPFAMKYHEVVGSMLWPLVITQSLVIAAVVMAITSRANTQTATV